MLDVPKHWRKGALIDLKRFSNGSYRATLLGEEPKDGCIDFDSSTAAQNWISAWYVAEQQIYV